MNLGNLIKEIRDNKSLTQQELANKLGITQEYLSLIETNQRLGSFDIIKKIDTPRKVSLIKTYWGTMLKRKALRKKKRNGKKNK